MRKAVPPITPPMIAVLEWEVEVEVGGKVEEDIVSRCETSGFGFSFPRRSWAVLDREREKLGRRGRNNASGQSRYLLWLSSFPLTPPDL